MPRKVPKLRRPGLLAIAFAVMAAAACVLTTPAPAQADIQWPVAYSYDESGWRTEYTSIEDALKAGYSGRTIIMNDNWIVSDCPHGSNKDRGGITVEKGKKLTIDMNGYTIDRVDNGGLLTDEEWAPTIAVQEGAELTLTASSSRRVQIEYEGFTPGSMKRARVTTTTGGLVTNTKNYSGGIYVCNSAKLTLDNVTVGGCEGSRECGKYGHHNVSYLDGGVTLGSNASLTMKNMASIEHNYTTVCGAGVFIAGSNCTVSMEGSYIHDNYAYEDVGTIQRGGGIYSAGSGNRIEMSKGSKIYGNMADAGGGIYFSDSGFTLTSSDGDAYVSNNAATHSSKIESSKKQSGGGIHVANDEGNKGGLIENITISDNRSEYDGGGIEIDQKGTTVRNCTITGNICKYEGGGICVHTNGAKIDGCTITGNACNMNGTNYEGGGVFVGCLYDVELGGKCFIKGNTRGKGGSADDLFLNENGGASAKAYVTGSLSAESTVGVRTGIEGDRRIAKNFKSETKDCFFIDLAGYYVSYGNDDGGDAWQRHRELAFALRLNGKQLARYKYNEKVVLNAPAADEGKVFWFWSTYAATGLNPVADYINAKNRYLSPLAFTMPQNDVSFGAVYADTVKKARVVLQYPVAGEELASTATIERTDGGFGGRGDQATVPVSWYEVATGADGSKTYAAAAGKAKPGTAYVARVSASTDLGLGLFYDGSLSTETVRFRSKEAGVSGYESASASASVDKATGVLTAQTSEFRTEGEAVEVKTAAVSVKMVNRGVLTIGVAASASVASLEEPLSLADDAEIQAEGGVIDTVEVTAAYDEDSGTVSIAAPSVEGYNFCNWEGVDEGWVKDDVSGVAEVPVDQLGLAASELTAVYTPVVMAAKTDLAAPVAGEALATSVKDIVVSCSDGTQGQSLAELFGAGEGGFEVVWSPEGEGEDGRAAWSTAYTALIRLTGDVEGLEGVEDVLARDAVVTCDGAKATSAGFAVVDGYLCLAVSFDATPDVRATSVSRPADVELTFDEAKACAESGEWQLPGTVGVELENGETVDGDVTWESVEGFDAAATGAQELKVKGTVTHIAAPDDYAVDTSGVSLDVTVTVKVAAPEDSASGEDDKKDEDEKKDDENEAKADENEENSAKETKTASKKGTPSTGDVTHGGLAGLLALAVVCLAAARLSRRKN